MASGKGYSRPSRKSFKLPFSVILMMYTTSTILLCGASLAKKIKLESRVVVHRVDLSAEDIINIKKHGKYGPIPDSKRICELEVNGNVIAQGKIIKKHGEYYFKILKPCLETYKNNKEVN